jgi:hypothetical protein
MEYYQPVAGAITSRISYLTNTVINELTNPGKYTIQQLMDALESDPVVYACNQLKALRGRELLHTYQNKNKEHQKFIQDNLNNMRGTIEHFTGTLTGMSMALGYGVLESVFEKSGLGKYGAWKLKTFHVLDPRKTSFKLLNGDICHVKYIDGGIEKHVPYWKTIHVANSMALNFGERSVYGSPEMLRAYPYIRLKQLMFGEMGISAKRLATGFVVGQADSNTRVQLYGGDGKPLPDGYGGYVTESSVQALSRQLQLLENHATMVTDKANVVSALAIPAGEGFWNLAMSLVDTQIMRAMLCPQSLLSEGSGVLGMATLSATQLSIFDSSIEAVVGQIRDLIIEKVVKPLLIWNFGKQDDYGSFEIDKKTDPNTENLVTNTLMSAMSMGLIQGSDIEATNKLREGVGLPPITQDDQMMLAQLQAQMTALQQAPSPELANPEDPGVEQPYP